jgi:hypothetical protein
MDLFDHPADAGRDVRHTVAVDLHLARKLGRNIEITGAGHGDFNAHLLEGRRLQVDHPHLAVVVSLGVAVGGLIDGSAPAPQHRGERKAQCERETGCK